MTNEGRAKELLEKYKESDKLGTKVYWVKASCLYFWKRDGLYEYLFDGAGTWGEFLNKLKVPPSSAQQKIKCWDFYVVNHKFKVSELEDYDSSSLYCIAQNRPTASKETIALLLEESREMDREDFIAMVKGLESCHHEHTEEVSETVEKCLDCKKKIRLQ